MKKYNFKTNNAAVYVYADSEKEAIESLEAAGHEDIELISVDVPPKKGKNEEVPIELSSSTNKS